MIPARLLPHIVQYAPLLGYGAGGPVWDTPRPLRCRIENGNRITRDDNAVEVVSTTRLYCQPADDLNVDGKITIGGSARTVVSIETNSGAGAAVEVVAINLQ